MFSNYVFKISGYSIGTERYLIILVCSIMVGLLMVAAADMITGRRTFDSCGIRHLATWFITPLLFAAINSALLFIPKSPYAHWGVAVIYLIIAFKFNRNTVFEQGRGDLNDNPFAVAGLYSLGLIGIAVPMFFLCQSKLNWQLIVSLCLLGVILMFIWIRAAVVNLDRKNLM